MTTADIFVKDKAFSIFIPESDISRRINELGARINVDYKDKEPLFIAVLNGSFMFASDLLKSVTVPCEITFVKVASYEATQSTGEVEEILGLEKDLKDRHVIIVEDIVDTGLTMSELLKNIRFFHPASVEVATLLLKPEALRRDLHLKYVGMEIPNKFVVGYGLDYDGFGRNLRDLYQLSEQTQ
jgi:hypoxanthine phosphoribosyltransferase